MKAAQSQKPILRVEVDLQPVDVQVKDAKGNNVLGLSAKDFTVFENGRPQKIAFFDAGNGPVSLAVLVDSSDSMYSNGRLGSAQAVAAQFMRTARPGDEMFAMDFTDQMGPFQRLTREQLLNPSEMTLAPAFSGGSALYDAIATALCHLNTSKNPRQAVIVISDGIDEYSRITLEQLIGLVRSSRAQLFMIGLPSTPEYNFQGHTTPKLTLVSGHDIDNPAVVFNRLMKESGAESFIPKSGRGLEEALKAVSNMLESEYTLAYYPRENASKLRKIEVKVDRHGAHVLTRRFVAPYHQGFIHFEEGTCAASPKFYPYPYESDLTKGAAGIIYREDFSNPHSGWPNHQDSHYVRGGYELSNSKEEIANPAAPVTKAGPFVVRDLGTTYHENVIAAYGPWWKDFRASAKINAALSSQSHEKNLQFPYATHPAAGLVFRLTSGGYYALLIRGKTSKKSISAELVKRDFVGDSYTETQIVPWTKLAIQPSNSEIELSVQATGDQISLFVNGQEIKRIRDDTFDQGLVGFVISGPGHATFKNLVVEGK